MKYFDIKNPFLKGLIGRYVSDEDGSLIVHGLSHGKGVGSTLLTFIVKKAFNVHRFPMWEDRHFTENFNRSRQYKLTEVMRHEMFINHIDDICNEMRNIYMFAQNRLDEDYPNQDFVKLYRNYKGEYALILLRMQKEALAKGYDYIEIGSDILNSFTDNPNTYGMDAHIEMEIPKSDILYYSSIFKDELMESEEFIVFNGRMNGLFKIPTNCIKQSVKDFDINGEHWNYRTQSYYNRDRKYGLEYNFINFPDNTHVKFSKLHQEKPAKEIGIVKRILKKLLNEMNKRT